MKYFDRDLSWLSFNYRVLMEAMDTSVPLMERLKFIAIYSSNLDEFFRVRVADVQNLVRIDKKKINKRIAIEPQQLLKDILAEVNKQLEVYGKAIDQVIDELKSNKCVICTRMEDIPEALKPDLLSYFKTKVLAFLRPIRPGKNERVFLDTQAIYLVMHIKSGPIEILNIPSSQLGRFYRGSVGDIQYFVFLEDIIRLHLNILLPGKEIAECVAIKLNKDADLQIDDEYEGDLVKKIEKQLQKRNLGSPSRFLYDSSMSNKLLKSLKAMLLLQDDDLVPGGRYHNLNDLFEISIDNQSLSYPPLPPISIPQLDETTSILGKIEKQDILLHFPYHSYDYILQFFNEAAIDPEVTEINVTFYRMAKDSLIGKALITAALNGKKVSVFMEVKARFDEANNLEWARRMKNAGVRIIYSLPGLKVHAKVALVKKRDRMYGFFGTGNLNEETAKIYTDHGMLTCHEEMTTELSYLFQYLVTRYTPPPFSKLIVSQFGALEKFHQLIDREIRNAEAGKESRMIIKVNNLQERSLINKIYEAADKGVDVKLIVRSICCLVPRNNLKVKRIVDRYLEHARVFYFYNNGDNEMFLGSSDWMNRNLYRRIEVCFPILDDDMKQEILTILKFQWRDDLKGVWLSEKLENIRPEAEHNLRAQIATYNFIKGQ
ncbi:MAG: RNA degradosome polyphosphate kinase [Ekhidna sp.]